MAGWLIVLYAITRVLPAPFGHGPEAIQTIDLICKFCEGLAMVSLAILIFQGLILNAGRVAAWRAVTLIVLFSSISGFATYGIARAAETVGLPWLAGQFEEHDEGDH